MTTWPNDVGDNDSSSSDADSGDHDDTKADVDAELDAVRDEPVAGVHDDQEHYMLCILGGRWTHEHAGEAADAAKAMARGGMPSCWAVAHHFPKSKRFHFSRYGLEGARMLAREVVRRGNISVISITIVMVITISSSTLESRTQSMRNLLSG